MTTTTETAITQTLRDLQADAPKGFALAFHIRFTTPTFLFQTYPRAWADYYSQNGLVMQDPTVAWGFENLGTQRWSDLAPLDTAGVMTKAAEYGLTHGVTIAVEEGDSRSIGSFARDDREFDETEVKMLHDRMAELHRQTAEVQQFSPETAGRLRRMAVTFVPSSG